MCVRSLGLNVNMAIAHLVMGADAGWMSVADSDRRTTVRENGRDDSRDGSPDGIRDHAEMPSPGRVSRAIPSERISAALPPACGSPRANGSPQTPSAPPATSGSPLTPPAPRPLPRLAVMGGAAAATAGLSERGGQERPVRGHRRSETSDSAFASEVRALRVIVP